MLISLSEACSFIAANHPIVYELWRRRGDSFTDPELISVIESCGHKSTPQYLLSQLKKLRLMVGSDIQEGLWALSPAFTKWLDDLGNIPQPISSSVINGRLNEFENLLNTFRAAMFRNDLVWGRELLAEARSSLERLAEDLLQTRAAIAVAVSDAKSEQRRQPPKERFRRINMFWTDYLLPMIELLNPSGRLEAMCALWEIQLANALEKKYLPDSRLAERIEREMQILRVTLRHSFRECRDELEPLHSQLRRDSALAEGAARILTQLERHGVNDLLPSQIVPLSSFRYLGQMSGPALLASAGRYMELTEPPPLIDFENTATPANIEYVEDMLAEIDALEPSMFPIDDLLDWLVYHYSDRGFVAILQTFSFLVTDSRFTASFHEPISEYEFCGGLVRCGKVKINQRMTA